MDVVCPVVAIFSPGYAGEGRVKKEAGNLKNRYRGKLVVPYVKLFLASQTRSNTQDILAAARDAKDPDAAQAARNWIRLAGVEEIHLGKLMGDP